MRLAMCVVAVIVCHGRPPEAVTSNAPVGAELDAFVRDYASALAARDTARVVSFYEPGVAMLGHNDGVAYSSDATIAAIKQFIGATRSIAIEFDTVTARPITGDLGIVWTTMRETWVDTSGNTGNVRVLISWMAQRRDGRWRFIYYDGRTEPPAAST
jgi:uncharacterized protein (TIGR02246 family)